MEYGDSEQFHKQKYEPIPGSRTCFWRRGPVSKDPYINIAYPDAGVFYWNAAFTVPEGAKMYLEGVFPYARYMSLISYDGRGSPVESLADYLIIPNDNSTNPLDVNSSFIGFTTSSGYITLFFSNIIKNY